MDDDHTKLATLMNQTKAQKSLETSEATPFLDNITNRHDLGNRNLDKHSMTSHSSPAKDSCGEQGDKKFPEKKYFSFLLNTKTTLTLSKDVSKSPHNYINVTGLEHFECSDAVSCLELPNEECDTNEIFLFPNHGQGSGQNYEQAFFTSLFISSVWILCVTPDNSDEIIKILRILQKFPDILDRYNSNKEEKEKASGAKSKQRSTNQWQLLLVVSRHDQQIVSSAKPEQLIKQYFGDKLNQNDFENIAEIFKNYFPNRRCIQNESSTSTSAKWLLDWFKNYQNIQEYFTSNLNSGINIEQVKEIVDVFNEIFSSMKVQHKQNPSSLESVHATTEISVEESIYKYKKFMSQKLDSALPVEEEVINVAHHTAMNVVLNPLAENSTKQLLKDKMQEQYVNYTEENKTLSWEKCLLLLQMLFQTVDEKLKKRMYCHSNGYDEYSNDTAELIESYKQVPGKGPMEELALTKFLKDREVDKQKIENPDMSFATEVKVEMSTSRKNARTDTVVDNLYRSLDFDAGSQEISADIGPHLLQYSIKVYHLERKLKKYREEISENKAMYEERIQEKENEIFQLRKVIAEIRAQNNTETMAIETDDLGSATSLNLVQSIPEKSWIHVIPNKDNTSKTVTQNYKTEEKTERELQLRESLDKSREKVKELAKANDSWAEYDKRQKVEHTKHVEVLMRELSETKDNVKYLRRKSGEMEEKLKELEKKHTTAIAFATTQTTKLDDLKKDFSTQLMKERAWEEREAQLTSVIDSQKDEIMQLKRNNQELQENNTQREVGIVNLTENNEPSPRDYHQASLYGHPNNEPLFSMQTENLLLKQQADLYEDDFKKERRDREKAHAEITSLRAQLNEHVDEIRILQHQLGTKETEIHALKAAREQDIQQIQRKQEELNKMNRDIRSLRENNQVLQNQINIARRGQGHVERREHVTPDTRFQQQSLRRTVPAPQIEDDTQFLPREWKNQIQANYTKFHMQLRTDQVIARLFSQKVISFVDKQQLDAIQPEYKKAEYIITNVILRGTKNDLRAFKQILMDTHQMELAHCLPGPANPEAIGRPWNCDVCTFRNNGSTRRCEMCGQIGPEIVTSRNFLASGFQQQRPPRDIEECDGDDEDEPDSQMDWVLPAS